MAEPGERLVRLRRADSDAKAARVLATLQAMVAAGEPPGVSVLARRAQVSRRFVYDHPELRAELARQAAQVADHHAGPVTASARATTASLRADLENARHETTGSTPSSPRFAAVSANSPAARFSPRSAPRTPRRSPGESPNSIRHCPTPRKPSGGAPTNSKPPARSTASSWHDSTAEAEPLWRTGVRHAKPQVRGHRHNSDSRKGHENVTTTQIYQTADMAFKQQALDRTTSPGSAPGRYTPSDQLLAFLDVL